jgi:hypothetical protein
MKFVTSRVQYLNIVRPLSELHIAKLFSDHPGYFPLATSCNRNWLLVDRNEHASHWCGVCPKCTFTFALLAAWLPEQEVTGIFGQNLFENASLLPLYRQLWGSEGFKPFECVGTPEETQSALYLARNKVGFKDTVIMHDFVEKVLPTMVDEKGQVEVLMTPDFELASSESARLLKMAGDL